MLEPTRLKWRSAERRAGQPARPPRFFILAADYTPRTTGDVRGNDRVEVTVLLPSPLPHHRTCGFPHPAVGPSGVKLPQDPMERSIRSSFSTFLLPLPLMASLASRRVASRRNPPALRPATGPESGHSCHFRPFRKTPRLAMKVVGMVCFVVLRPFAPRPFGRFLATTASADFSQALTREISPGKAPKLSARAARLYLMRLSVTVGFRVP